MCDDVPELEKHANLIIQNIITFIYDCYYIFDIYYNTYGIPIHYNADDILFFRTSLSSFYTLFYVLISRVQVYVKFDVHVIFFF